MVLRTYLHPMQGWLPSAAVGLAMQSLRMMRSVANLTAVHLQPLQASGSAVADAAHVRTAQNRCGRAPQH